MYEMIKLWRYLTEHYYNVKWEFTRLSRTDPDDEIIYRNQIIVYDEKHNRLWDAICHAGSYGMLYVMPDLMGTNRDYLRYMDASVMM